MWQDIFDKCLDSSFLVTWLLKENQRTQIQNVKLSLWRCAEDGRQSRSPFDRALEVGLADCAVIDEYCRAGAVFFRQEPRGHLREKRWQFKKHDAHVRGDTTLNHWCISRTHPHVNTWILTFWCTCCLWVCISQCRRLKKSPCREKSMSELHQSHAEMSLTWFR